MVDGRWSMVDALWLMVDDLWSMACGLWSMVDVNRLTHGVTSLPVCLHRESNEVVQAVDRQLKCEHWACFQKPASVGSQMDNILKRTSFEKI